MSKSKKNARSDSQYKERQKELRKYYSFSFDLRNKLTPARKAAITRAENRFKTTIKPALEKGGKFVKANRGTKAAVRALGGSRAIATKGYVLTPPINADSVRYDKKQNAIITKVKGAVFKTYLIADPVKFVKNPDAFMKKLPDFKKADFVRLNVGAGHYLGNLSYDKASFNRYITTELNNPEDFITGVTLVFGDDFI